MGCGIYLCVSKRHYVRTVTVRKDDKKENKKAGASPPSPPPPGSAADEQLVEDAPSSKALVGSPSSLSPRSKKQQRIVRGANADDPPTVVHTKINAASPRPKGATNNRLLDALINGGPRRRWRGQRHVEHLPDVRRDHEQHRHEPAAHTGTPQPPRRFNGGRTLWELNDLCTFVCTPCISSSHTFLIESRGPEG